MRMAQSVGKFEPYKDCDNTEYYFERLKMFFAVTVVKEGKLAHWVGHADICNSEKFSSFKDA